MSEVGYMAHRQKMLRTPVLGQQPPRQMFSCKMIWLLKISAYATLYSWVLGTGSRK